MDSWSPITESEILALIEVSEYDMDSFTKSVWDKIRIPKPIKWVQHP